jgi:ATP-dependent DNA helicase RecG
VIREITADMGRSKTMHRLLQGDVGSGKTLVAMAAICVAVHNGYQAVLMAPTEILAEQHYLVLSEKFKELGIEVELMIGGLTKKEKEAARERLSSGTAQIAIGTHALIQENVDFSNLGLVVIDEQHRFGVVQRAALRQKGLSPDVLVMTATPIPRTLALTLYGDLDVSVIDELPPGRKPIKTHWKYTTDRNKVYAAVKKLIAEGRQAYVVCPLVEESEKLEVQAATKLAEQLQTQVFPDLRVGLLHGQMRPREKEAVMAAFRRGEIDILASTTVIEVGVDVPNASVMVIEDAVRFGLAQLHQLRGRVGRGEYQSYCILLADPKTDDGIRRMEVMTRTNDGFVIAEEDLQIRGPGEFYGTRQHGLPSLRIADIIKDITVLEIAREEAFKLLSEDPHLQKFENRVLRDALTRKMVDFELAAIG